MDLDPSNPNLDGDYKAFLEIEETSKAEEKPKYTETPNLQLVAVSDLSVSVEDVQNNTHLSDEMETEKESIFLNAHSEEVGLFKHRFHNLLKNEVNFSDRLMRNHDDMTILHFAIFRGSFAIAKEIMMFADKELLMSSFTLTVKGMQTFKTNLHLLVQKGNIELLDMFLDLISKSAQKREFLQKATMTEMPGQRPRQLAGIHLAALEGKANVIKVLHKHDPACINLQNDKKDTPILWAARQNHLSAVKLLLDLGANPNISNDKGSTALYWAVRYGFPDMTTLILDQAKSGTEKSEIVNFRRQIGFERPIILAAALGYVNILRILIRHGANMNVTRAGGSTALHMAASIGRLEVVECLLENGADKEAEDNLGNTPLLVAVKNNKLHVVRELLTNGANIHAVNKYGECIWDLAIAFPSTEALQTLLTLYKKLHARRGSLLMSLNFGENRSPIHSAAMCGNVEKLKLILSMGFSPNLKDRHGNTFFHVAAKENAVEILKEFIAEFDVNETNAQQETPIQLAVHFGHTPAVQILLNKSDLSMRNSANETVLHVCAHSKKSTPEIADMLVDAMVKTQSWDLIDATDVNMDTALHVATRNGRCDLLQAFSHLNPTILNGDGNSPLHVAAKSGDEETMKTMLRLFCNPMKGFQIDMPTNDGDTLLHVCAQVGNMALIELILQNGADLSGRDDAGKTVFHDLAYSTSMDPLAITSVLSAFRLLVDHAALWWCNSHFEQAPDRGTTLYLTKSQTAMRFLLEDIPDNDGLNVIEYSTSLGAVDFLCAIFNLEGIYVFPSRHEFRFDVTNLAPETKSWTGEQKKDRKTSNRSGRATVAPHDIDSGERDQQGKKKEMSCLDIAIEMSDEVLATSVLEVRPLNFLTEDYWALYRYIFFILMVLHIVNMSLYSAYSIPLARKVWKNDSNVEVDHVYACFLIWPIIILIFSLFTSLVTFVQYLQGLHRQKTCCKFSKGVYALLYNFFMFIMANIDVWGSLLFGFSVVAWYVLYSQEDRDQVYPLTVALISGWCYTIFFTKGFETVHSFSIILKHIIVRDISRFLFIYVFILLGFSFGIRALQQISPILADSYPTAGHSLFISFDILVGQDSIIREDLDDNFSEVDSSSLYIRIVYILYIMMATIVLLNLLIAMMSDTYNEIKSREGATWRIGSLSMAIRIERSLPVVASLFRRIRNSLNEYRVWYEPSSQRYFISIPKDQLLAENVTVESEEKQAISKLEGNVLLMREEMDELNRKLDEITDLLRQRPSSNVHASRAPTKTFKNAAKKLIVKK